MRLAFWTLALIGFIILVGCVDTSKLEQCLDQKYECTMMQSGTLLCEPRREDATTD